MLLRYVKPLPEYVNGATVELVLLEIEVAVLCIQKENWGMDVDG